jgi:hypothetical protein
MMDDCKTLSHPPAPLQKTNKEIKKISKRSHHHHHERKKKREKEV